jgi:hypothetical protein
MLTEGMIQYNFGIRVRFENPFQNPNGKKTRFYGFIF